MAVDAAGTLWVYWEEEGDHRRLHQSADQNGRRAARVGAGAATHAGSRRANSNAPRGPSFAVGPADEAFYVGYERESAREECPGEEGETPDSTAVAKLKAVQPVPDVLAREVDHQATTGVAVDQASGEGTPLGAGAVGDVYLDNGSSVAAFTPGGRC